MKKVGLAICVGLTLFTTNAFANGDTNSNKKIVFGGFFGDEVDDEADIKENQMSDGSNTKFESNQNMIQLEKRPEPKLAIAQREKLERLIELSEMAEQANNSMLNDVEKFSKPSQPIDIPTPPIENTKNNLKPSELEEQKRIENFVLTTQSFLNESIISSLKPEYSIAINIFNSALLQIAVMKMSDLPVSGSQDSYNKAVGCINGFLDNNLNNAATKLMTKYASQVDISAVVRAGPQIGSGFKAQCY